ncbi:MAG: alpha/beta hydrolase [Deltaproteobacteria bacterium]|nr:alpha/beta hydrolase [Deltaproteobacteria bacterium]
MRALGTRLRGVPALLAATLACSPPPDAGRTRPETVRATPFEQRDARVLGLRTRYIDVGPTESAGGPAAAPALLLVPGHTSRIEEYDALVPALARRHRVVVMDYPGSGWAEKPDREYSLRLYEDASVALLDQLGIGEALLAGGSQGGNLVLRLGHRFPERFPRLAPWAPGSAWEAQPRVGRLMRAVRGYALFWPIVWVQSRFWYRRDWPGRDAALAETFAYYREVMGPGFVRMYFEMAADQVESSLFDIAPAIHQPVWLGWGDQDDGANMGEGVARLCALLPRCELRIFPGARHSLAAEIPDELAAAVEEFFTRRREAAEPP